MNNGDERREGRVEDSLQRFNVKRKERERKRVPAGPTLKSDLVALERVHGRAEEGLVAAGLTRDVVLVKLDRDGERLEDGLDRVGELVSDTVSGDEGDLEEHKRGKSAGEREGEGRSKEAKGWSRARARGNRAVTRRGVEGRGKGRLNSRCGYLRTW